MSDLENSYESQIGKLRDQMSAAAGIASEQLVTVRQHLQEAEGAAAATQKQLQATEGELALAQEAERKLAAEVRAAAAAAAEVEASLRVEMEVLEGEAKHAATEAKQHLTALQVWKLCEKLCRRIWPGGPCYFLNSGNGVEKHQPGPRC